MMVKKTEKSLIVDRTYKGGEERFIHMLQLSMHAAFYALDIATQHGLYRKDKPASMQPVFYFVSLSEIHHGNNYICVNSEHNSDTSSTCLHRTHSDNRLWVLWGWRQEELFFTQVCSCILITDTIHDMISYHIFGSENSILHRSEYVPVYIFYYGKK